MMTRTMLFTVTQGIKVFCKFKFLTFFFIWLLLVPFSQGFAQGSITGTVNNSDMSVPADSELTFWGFLDDTDEEIRTELSDGAGYQNPYWWDDFQNYGTEAAGNPYDYYFSNLVNGGAYHLQGLIPNNSYQEENIVLAFALNPSKPTGIKATVTSTSRVVVSWNKLAGITYHVYRRYTSSNGSLFRLDDPSGSLANSGVSDSFFVDTTVDGVNSFTYMVIGENASGNYTPHSDEATGNSSVPTAPVVASIFPDTGPTVGGTWVTITGENFDQAGVTVTIGTDTATSVILVSPFELTCLAPAGSAGSADVSVTNIASSLTSSPLAGAFTYYVNTPPVADAGPDQLGIIAGSLVTLDGSGSSDTDGDSLGYHWSQISGPTAVLSDSNIVNPTFTPNTGGAYYFQLFADDAIDYSQPDTVMIAVENQPPVLDSIGSKLADEGQTLEFRVSATDSDGDSIILTADDVPLNATFVDSGNGAGSFTFNPDYTQTGLYNVTFMASDGSLADSEVVSITVNDVNRVPVLDSIGSKSVDEGQTLEFRVSATDQDLDSIILTSEDVPLNATFIDSGNGAGSFSFNPDYTQAGVYNVTFIASDGSLSDSEVVAITVNDVNRSPVLDSIGSRSVDEGQTSEFRVHATDPDGDAIALSAVDVPTNATFVDSGNGAGSFTFNPDYTQAGVYNVTFVASDGSLADSEAVAITVNDVNRAPVADAGSDQLAVEAGSLVTLDGSGSYDPDGDSIGYHWSQILGSSVALSDTNAVNPTFTPDIKGNYEFELSVDDGLLMSSPDTVLVSVDNQTPVLDSIGPKFVDEGQLLEFRVSASDPDGDAMTLSAEDVPANATLVDSGNGAGSLTFNPDFTQSGVYNLTFIASDGSLADSELVAITVNDVNRSPMLASIGAKNVDEGQTLEFKVSATDPDGDALTLSAVDVPTNATFVDSGNGAGSFTFDPDYIQAGVYNVTFITSDGTLADSEVVNITVNDVNRTPLLEGIGSMFADEGQTLEFRVHATDPDGDVLTLSAENVPTNATFADSGNGAGSFTFNPDYTQAGVYNVTFIASDGSLADSESVAVTVNDINQAPVLDSVGARIVDEGQTLEFRVSATDPDGDAILLTAENVPLNASFVDSGGGAGSFTFNPDYTQAGLYSVTFIASDGGLADSELVSITVNESGNQAPVLDSIGSRSVNETESLAFRIHATDLDLDSIILTAENVPLNATFADSGNGAGSFTFNPDYTQSGVYNVTFIASDGSLADSEIVEITVNNTNRAPVLDFIGSRSVLEGGHLGFMISASDPDGEPLTLTAENIPTNSTFSDSGNGKGLFEFDPDYTQSGLHYIIFKASDGDLVDSEVVQITVIEAGNQSPVLDSIGTQTVAETETLIFKVSATDPDGSTPALIAYNWPANSTFVDSGNGNGSFSFYPNYDQAGIYTVGFVTTDGSLADTELVEITVTETNRTPVLDAIGSKIVNEGENLVFRVSATDPDLDSIILSAVDIPTNGTFVDSGNGAGSFTFSPDYIQSGLYSVIFIASDGALADSEVVSITVNEVGNQAPVLDSIGSKFVDEAQTVEFRVSVTDPDGDSIILAAGNVPTNATFVDSGNGAGSFTFDPDYTQAGLYNVTFTSSDGSLADSEVVAITVNDVNRVPVLDSIGSKLVDEGQTLEFRVSATDPDLDSIILTAETVPTNATFVDSGNGAGSFTFNPDYTQAGVYNVTFIASDGSLADSELVAITVNEINQAPVLDSTGSEIVDEGQTLEFRLSATDPDGDAVTLSAENVPINATFVDSGNGAGSFTFSPDYTQAGGYDVTFIASDGSLADSELVSITVNEAGNQAPVLDSISSKTVDEGQVLSFRVHATDLDNDSLILSAVDVPTNATFVDSGNGAGSFTFNPDYTQAGIYNVTFIASDGSLADSEVVAVTVNHINLAPVLDSIGSKLMDEGQTLEFRVSSTDPDADALILTAEDVPTNATFVDSGTGAGSFTFNPDYTQAGIYNVTFITSDGSLADSELVQITVNEAGNQAPVLDSIGSKSIDEGQTLEFRVSATDPDLDSIILTAENVPTNATFVDSGNGTGAFTFNPDYTQAGIYNVTFIASDGSLADSEIVAITVNHVNRAPVLDSTGSKIVDEGQTLEFRVSSTDPDGDALTLSAENVPANASFVDSGNGAGSFTFNPDYTQVGIYNVTFIASDGTLADSELVQITVNEAGNQAPVLDSIGAKSVDENQTLEFRVSAADPDADSITLSAEGVPTNASFADSGNGAGAFTFNPTYDQAGTYNVTYIASDGSLADSELVAITVNDVNRAPVLDSIGSKVVEEGQTLEFRVSATDSDGDAVALTAVDVPPNASFVDSGNGAGSFTFNPDYTQSGLYSITFKASDGLLPDSELVSITVNDAGNQSPVLDSIGSKSVDEGQALEFSLSAADPDADALTLTAEGVPTNATFVDSGNGAGSFTFNPTYDQAGTYNVTYIASDGSLADSELVAITVNDVNRAPVLDSIGSKAVDEGQTLEFRVSATDPDGDAVALTAVDVPPNASFVDSGNGAGSFTFNPDYTQAGLYSITFKASDGILPDSESVSITVNEAGNQVPVLDSIGAKSMNEGEILSFRAHATDLDNDSLILSIVDIPTNATFVDSGNAAGSFTFSPDYTQAGLYSITFIASDGSLADSEIVEISVAEAGNQAPVVDSIGSRTVDEGDTLVLLITASDPDNDSLILSANSQPFNSTFIDSGNGKGVFTFIPDYYQSGVDTVTFIAMEKKANPLSDYENVSLTIIDVNQPPVFDSIGPQNVAVYETLSVRLVATDTTDPDGGSLHLTAAYLPVNSTFADSGAGVGGFVFAPDTSQMGTDTVIFYCTDEGSPPATGSELMIITVQEGANMVPVLEHIGSRQVVEAETLSFIVLASDPNGTIPVLYTGNLPRNATFVDSGNGRGLFTFAPDYAQQGLREVTFYAGDGELVDYEDVFVQVLDAGNQLPILNSIGARSVTEGDTLTFSIYAVDPDSIVPELYADSLPVNATFVDNGDGGGIFTFTPVYVQSGVYDVIFFAYDGELADSEVVQITVNDAGNQTPIMAPIDSQVVVEQQRLIINVEATDPDSTIPFLRVWNLPENATFIDIGDGTGVFDFTPSNFQAGVDSVIFEAVDYEDTLIKVTQSVQIRVLNVNRKPAFQQVSTQQMDEGDTLTFNVSAADPDSTIPTLLLPIKPQNSTFIDSGNGVGTFSFYPDYSQSGTLYPLFLAMDVEFPADPETVFMQVQIVVYDVPQPPVWADIPDTSVTEGDTLILQVSASDPDGVPPVLSAVGLPSNSGFTDNEDGTGTLTFSPNFVQAGTSWVSFIVTDPTSFADTQEVQIVVIDAGNQRPILAPIQPEWIVAVTYGASFTIQAADPDSTIPVLSASQLPDNASFYDSGSGTGLFEFTPDTTQADSVYQIIFIASDDGLLADSQAVACSVIAYQRGDVDGDREINVVDVVYLINYLFNSGPEPRPLGAADVDGDGEVNIVDVVYLVNYLFNSGPAPPRAGWVDADSGRGVKAKSNGEGNSGRFR